MKLLVAEDEPKTGTYLQQGLSEAGFTVDRVTSGTDALQHVLSVPYDLLILDVMMPGLDGWEVLRLVRASGNEVPVLFLTARDRVEDRVKGLELGADDYLVKPFAFSELLARVNALARRPVLAAEPTVLRLGRMSLDLIRHSVTCGGRPIELQPREFRLLEFLMRNAERLVTRTMMLEHVWEFHFDPKTSVVETHISRLRAKIEGHDGAPTIKTIRGAGYILHVSQDMAHEHDRAAGAN